ncbi:MAG: hypothetical protein HZA04_00880 [Nitrospinae bacterium]|nr:hypothetical protein [Nitrospinota bacterium]
MTIFRALFSTTIMVIALSSAPARAEDFSTTSLLAEYAGNLRDPYYGNNAVDGAVNIVTLEHFGTWEYGDNFFFVDMVSGRLADFNGNDAHTRSRLYLEWGPRISLSKVSGTPVAFGPVRDVLLAAQVNRDGEGYNVEMFGLGVDLALPAFSQFSVNLYSRKDNLNSRTYQVTASWGLPFTALSAPFLFEGYIDVAGTDNNGEDINTQPRLFVDLSKLAGKQKSALLAGVEWYYHKNRWMEMNVPLWTLKWNW